MTARHDDDGAPAKTGRRSLVLVGLGAALVGAGALWFGTGRARRRELPRLVQGQQVLRMPFRRGTLVACQQGNFQPAGRTHSAENALHALDFANPLMEELEVVAAADGTVDFIFDGAPREVEPTFGGGFGNQLAVTHEDGCYSFYAHLRSIAVERGQRVACGERLGLAGMTGAAGNRHLHLSVHRAPAGGPGAPPSLPIQALLSAELREPNDGRAAFKLRAGDGFVSGPDDPWQGLLYASENDGADASPTLGELASVIDPELAARGARLRAVLEDRRSLERLEHEWARRDAGWAEATLAPMLERAPESAPLLYWRAVAVDLARGEGAAARANFEALLKRGTDSPTWEDWLGPAIRARLARL